MKLNACPEAMEWVGNKSWEECYATCHIGDWLLWLFKRTNPDDLRLLTLAKGHCANTVRHLMKDERSLKAVEAAIAFGEGKISREKLNTSAYAAADYAAAAAAYADYAAAYAAAAASAAAAAAYTASAAAYAASAAAASDAAAYVAYAAYAYAAKKENQQLTADICRKYLPIEVWNIK